MPQPLRRWDDRDTFLALRKVTIMRYRIDVMATLTFGMAGFLAYAQTSGTGTPDQAHRHHRYRVIDLGTPGGTFAEPGGINNRSEIEGFSTLPGDEVLRGFFWSRGQFTALPGLGGPNSTASWAISDSGQVGAAGDTGQPDPLGEDFCGFGDFTICLPFVWQRGRTTVLPLPSGNNGAATGFNNRDEVTGKVEQD